MGQIQLYWKISMRIKTILLPRRAISRPIPYWEIGSIAANVKSKCQEFKLIDLETANYYTRKYNDFLEEFKPFEVLKKENRGFIHSVVKDIGNIKFDIFYFYIDWWNETLPLAIAVANQIKKLNKKARILLSGPYLNSYGKEILDKFKFIDYIAVSEIEPVFNKLLDNSVCSSEIPNIVYFDRNNNKVAETKKIITDINELLFPEFDSFFKTKQPAAKILPFRLSRGCKYRCFFCACLSAEQLRYYRNIDVVVKHLKQYNKKYNINNFYFEDDALNFNNDYLEEFLNKLIQAKLNIKWSAYFIAKDLPLAIIEKIRKAGCVHIRWGIESVHPSIASKIAKDISILEAEKILSDTAKIGISNQISLIVGFPHENNISIKHMKSFIVKNKQSLKIVNAYTFKPRAGTLAYKHPERYGINILKDNAVFKKDVVPFDETNGLIWRNKRAAQQLFLKVINGVIQDNQLLNIDPREHFKQII